MTARKYTVSKRGVKREVRGPKATARERLLAHVCALVFVGYDEKAWDAKTRRLLRARERELAERVGDVAAATLDEMAAELLMPDDADVERVWRVRLRAAILAPQAKRGRVR